MELQHAQQRLLGLAGPQLKTAMTRSTAIAKYLESIKIDEKSLWSKKAVVLRYHLNVCQSYARIPNIASTKMISEGNQR